MSKRNANKGKEINNQTSSTTMADFSHGGIANPTTQNGQAPSSGLSEQAKTIADSYLKKLKLQLVKVSLLNGVSVDFDKIYVEQTIKRVITREEREEREKKAREANMREGCGAVSDNYEREIGVDAMLNEKNNLVITGSAGLGKSLFVKKLIRQILADEKTISLKKDCYLPIYITLRDYGSWQDFNTQKNFADYVVEKVLSSTLNSATKEDLINIVKNTKVVCVCDGADEVTATGAGKLSELINKVSEFAVEVNAAGATCKVIITSRPFVALVAGEASPVIAGKNCDKFTLANFNDKTRSQYLDNYFASSANLATDKKEVAKDRFIKELNKLDGEVPDYKQLSTTPFLLLQMLRIFE